MQSEWIEQLLIYQDRDLKLEGIERQLAEIPGQIAHNAKAIEAEHERVSAQTAALAKLEVKRKELELEVAGLEAQLLRYKTQQLEVKKNEEYAALTKEIDHAQDEIARLEDTQIDVMEQQETGRVALEALKAEVAGAIETIEAHTETLRRSEASYGEEVAAARVALESARAAVPTALAKAYDYVKRQVKRGPYVVAMQASKCMGCHLKVSGEIEGQVRHKTEGVRCDNCGRLLYYE